MRNIRVALIDFGVKRNIERCLVERNCRVRVFPMNTPLARCSRGSPTASC
jgi:carbamoyl-phosphate synthase small subunit